MVSFGLRKGNGLVAPGLGPIHHPCYIPSIARPTLLYLSCFNYSIQGFTDAVIKGLMIFARAFPSRAVRLVAPDSINEFLESLDSFFHFFVLPHYAIFKGRQDNKC